MAIRAMRDSENKSLMLTEDHAKNADRQKNFTLTTSIKMDLTIEMRQVRE
jgi:hypothetical protein